MADSKRAYKCTMCNKFQSCNPNFSHILFSHIGKRVQMSSVHSPIFELDFLARSRNISFRLSFRKGVSKPPIVVLKISPICWKLCQK